MSKHSLFFVHIPKTGGNSVRVFLTRNKKLKLLNKGRKKCEREHHFGIKNARRVKDSHLSFKTDYFPSYVDTGEYKKASFSFTVLRNPYDLLYSYYNHSPKTSPSKKRDNGWGNVNEYHKFKSFSEFIDGYCNMDPEEWHVPALSKNLFGQIFIDNNKLGVDYAIFLETINMGIAAFYTLNEEKKNAPVKLPKLNTRTKIKGAKQGYSKALKDAVSKKCEWELDTFYGNQSKNNIIDLREIENGKPMPVNELQ
tara:strand:- start:673 stop:1431 length:759 start_codon:yes stop_codon:yes gene_type:complete